MFPLSPLQLGMLFENGAGTGGEYVQQLVVTSGDSAFDADRARECWARLAEKIPALRAAVDAVSGAPRMEFRAAVEPQIESRRAAPEALEEFLAADRSRGIAVAECPLWRVTLLDFGRGGALVWTFHHILLDGRSHARIFEVFWRMYDGGTDAPDDGPEFVEFLGWLAERDDQPAEGFFRDLLEGTVPLPRLTTGASFDPVPVPARAVLGRDERLGMEAAAERLGATLHTLVQAAWGLVLCRHGDSSHAVFGSVRAGRHWGGQPHPDALGCFIATVPFPVRISADMSVGEWIAGLRAQQTALRPHEHTAITSIRRWCGLAGPAFRTILMFERGSLAGQFKALGGPWAARKIFLREKIRDPALSVVVDDGIEVALDYPPGDFAPAEMRVLLDHFCSALRVIAACGHGDPVARISLMAPGEEERIAGWSRTGVPLAGGCLHEWLDRRASGCPEAPALDGGGEVLTYGDLVARSRLLAWWLGMRYHVGVGDRVVAFVDREPAMPVIMLALSRIGAVYVPLDPSTPASRICQGAGDSGAVLAITTSAHAAAFPNCMVPAVPVEDLLSAASEAMPGSGPPGTGGPVPDDPASILFTSGSTGTPKGALTSHRGLVNLAESLRRVFPLPAGTRVAQISSPSFDASVLDVLLAFSSGGTLVFGSWNELQPGDALARFLRDRDVSAAFFTPTLLRTIPPDSLPALQTIFCGGEVCPPDLASEWAEGREFFNLYGPTEATVFTLYERVVPPLNGHPALGVNLPNTRTVIRDASGSPCPIGVPGELCIGGVAVGPGYINLPERTDEAFVADPDNQDGSNRRLYRTGDRAVRLPDGRVDFVERMDRQVKIRGVRIEPGEIESGLLRCAGVREAAVVVEEGDFVAYVAPAVNEAALRRELAENLPFYLVPARIEMRGSLPKTVSGKLDRVALRGARPAEREIRLLSEGDRQRVLVHWNPVGAAPERCVHDLMSEFAAAHPGATAVGHSVSYGDLDRASNRIARLLLRDAGDGPVVVFAAPDHGVPAILAGVLKSGRPYVPLDPSLPDDRIAYIVEQSGTCAAITQPDLVGRISAPVVIVADPADDYLAGIPNSPPGIAVSPDAIAYIIYTSGSTGRPKGVEIPHRALANLCWHYRTRLGLGPDDRSSLLASISFDASVADLWPYLACGASVHVPPSDAKSDLRVLSNWLAGERITRCFAPTALGELMFDLPWPSPPPLRDLLVGGDRLTRHPGTLPFRVINTYGPTECTVDAVWFDVPQTGEPVPPPIGRPITNYSAYIVDPELRPVAVGEPGELLLGGAGVAAGYRNQPALTAERFLPNPFAPGRIYRTGDIARFRPDGVIEFIGRADNQVQIHGFRVELGEIESALRSIEGIREAHVRMDPQAKKPAVIAYFSADPDIDRSAIRHHLARLLPPYMIPAAFVRMDALPRNTAGKVDKDQLPEPDADGGDGEPPVGGIETDIHALACDVLGVGRIGMTSNFFDSGGDSILLLSLLLRVEKKFGCEVGAMNFLQNPCLRNLAGLVGGRAAKRPGCVLPIRPEGKKAPFFCICPASWFRPIARHTDPARPMLALEVLLLDPVIVADPQIEVIAAAFVAAVRTIQPEGTYHLGGYSSNGMAVVEMARILRSQGESLAPVFLFDVFAPDLLRTGPVGALYWKFRHFLTAPSSRKRELVGRIFARRKPSAPPEARVAAEIDRLAGFARRLHVASLAYRPEPIDADLVVIKSSIIPDILPDRKDLGWSRLCRSCESSELPGDHRTFLENSEAIARIINSRISGASPPA